MNVKLKNWQGTTQQILIGLVLATIVVAVIEANSDYDEDCGWSLAGTGVDMRVRGGDRYKIRIGRGRCRLDVDLRGDIDFSPDNRGVARLGPESAVSIRERRGAQRRRLDVEPGADGKPEYTWYVGSLPKALDDEARGWLAGVLPRIYRTSGLDADGRVKQLQAAGGLDAVIAEMDEISRSDVRGEYLRQLIAQTTQAGELVRVLDYGRRRISSDHELARSLGAVDTARLGDASVREAWVQALRSIDSDWELRRALTAVAEGEELDGDVVAAIIDAARTVSSDQEQGVILRAVASHLPPDLRLPSTYYQALESIGSDHEHRRTLRAALERPGLTQEEAARLLATAEKISGDYELAELLAAFARDAPRGWMLPESYFQVLGKIDSDSSMRRALETVVEHRDLDPELAAALLGTARAISTDSELAGLLVRFLEVYPSAAKLPEEFDGLMRSVNSDFERSRVEEVLAAYRRRAPGPESVLVEAESSAAPEDGPDPR